MKYEDLPEIEKARIDYSDLHKEIYGFRPRFTSGWTLEDYDKEYKSLIEHGIETGAIWVGEVDQDV